jgi:hypothetical protein
LRSILIAPSAGFRSALRTTERRAERGDSPAEGWAPFVLAAVGGGALMLLFLKISALAGLREGSVHAYRISFLAVALGLGALLGLAAQVMWGRIGPGLAHLLGGSSSAPSARLVWGASFFPQVFTVLVLFPIDLLVAGDSAFTDARPEDPVAAAWAALSLSLGVALALWSFGLLVRGFEISSDGIGFRRAALGALGAVICVAAVGIAFRFGVVALAEAA